MKKRGIVTVLAAMLLVLICFTYVGCNQTPTDNTPKEYVIQYTDDSGTYKLTVTDGMPFTLDVVPTKEGYKFIGLFDAEVGGTQYVSASGASLAPFTDGKNMVLFPQFKANDYSVILDYQGAQVTGQREFTVAYGDRLPELPVNLQGAHKTFVGWYTQPNCEGLRVADKDGNLPVVSVLNNDNFDLSKELIYLYAGFEIEKFTVTCYFEAGMEAEELQVEYDTPANKIVPETRVDGKAPLTWSKTLGGEVFNGKITDDTVLYALEYAPVINLDSNGGSKVNSIVARAGSAISLPTPTKDLAKFAYWEDMKGNKYDSTTMPSNSISLKAVWQAKLVFDSNGGSDVKEISEKAGETITLPTPEKEGFIFAGWYNADKDKYTSTRMPVEGIKLKAGWYKAKSVRKTFLESSETSSLIHKITPSLFSNYKINFAQEVSEIDWNKSVNVFLEFHADIKHTKTKDQFRPYPTYATKEHIYFYSQEQVSDAYLMGKCLVDSGNGSINESYVTCDFNIALTINSGMLYIGLGTDKDNWYYQYGSLRCGAGWIMTNFWAEIFYPDTTNLYL